MTSLIAATRAKALHTPRHHDICSTFGHALVTLSHSWYFLSRVILCNVVAIALIERRWRALAGEWWGLETQGLLSRAMVC